MKLQNLLITSVLAAALPFANAADPVKNARITYYDPGLGACGKTSSASDAVVALNSQQYGNGEHCGKQITITVGSKTAKGTILDKCPGCPNGGLDLSPSLFSQLGNKDAGVLTGEWSFD